VLKELRALYGLEETVKRKRRRSGDGTRSNESSDTETEATGGATGGDVVVVAV
jgi:hypothetical protein